MAGIQLNRSVSIMLEQMDLAGPCVGVVTGAARRAPVCSLRLCATRRRTRARTLASAVLSLCPESLARAIAKGSFVPASGAGLYPTKEGVIHIFPRKWKVAIFSGHLLERIWKRFSSKIPNFPGKIPVLSIRTCKNNNLSAFSWKICLVLEINWKNWKILWKFNL